MDSVGTISQKVDGCARCGQIHPVSFQELSAIRPFAKNGRLYSHWGICPVTGDPVFMSESEGEVHHG